jgi:hypothetical protein
MGLTDLFRLLLRRRSFQKRWMLFPLSPPVTMPIVPLSSDGYPFKAKRMCKCRRSAPTSKVIRVERFLSQRNRCIPVPEIYQTGGKTTILPRTTIASWHQQFHLYTCKVVHSPSHHFITCVERPLVPKTSILAHKRSVME